MVEINRKPGWTLNPDDKRVNNIIRAVERNNGNCPCQKEANKCPCTEYLNNDNCHCGLYMKIN